jgi:hypothetical protein
MVKVTLKKLVAARFGIRLWPGRPYPAKQESADRWIVWISNDPRAVSILVSDKNVDQVLDID